MDPVRNPYAPGAGQRPPELAGRDREIQQFEVVLERVARARPERSMVLTGLRGVGKTVMLNTFRSMAMQKMCAVMPLHRPGKGRDVDSHSKCNVSEKTSAGVWKSRHFRGV